MCIPRVLRWYLCVHGHLWYVHLPPLYLCTCSTGYPVLFHKKSILLTEYLRRHLPPKYPTDDMTLFHGSRFTQTYHFEKLFGLDMKL